MRLRPGRRLPGLLVAAGVIYFFATNSGVVWLYLLTALVLALLPIGLVAPVLALRGLRLRALGAESHGFAPPLRRDRSRIFAGDRMRMRLEVSGNLDACRLGPLLMASGDHRVAVRCGEAVETDAGRRGMLEAEAIIARSGWPLGIFTAERRVRLNFKVIVHPRYCLPRRQQRAGIREPAGASSRRGQGDEFLGLRHYQPGDSQRRIHWPSTAKTGELMVIETALEANSPGVFRLGIDADADQRSADLAVEVTASLAAGCVAEGRSFRVAVGRERGSGGGWDDALTRLSLARTGEGTRPSGEKAVMVTARRDGVDVELGDEVRRLAPELSLAQVEKLLEEMA